MLTAAVDAMAQSHPGFYFGRFDVRSPSIEDLQGGSFEVLELNGVSAEATHIYDPSVSLRKAYRTLLVQWRIAFEIGAINRTTGSGPMPLKEFLCLVYCATRRGRVAPDGDKWSTQCVVEDLPRRRHKSARPTLRQAIALDILGPRSS
jgi:hypothetical protein